MVETDRLASSPEQLSLMMPFPDNDTSLLLNISYRIESGDCLESHLHMPDSLSIPLMIVPN